MPVFPGITASDIAQMADGSLIVGSGVGTFTVTASPELRELTITAAAADKVPLIIEGAPSQTADLAQWNPAGVAAGQRARITSDGKFCWGTSTIEIFGKGAGAGSGGTAFGSEASAGYGVAVGRQAVATHEGLAIGRNCTNAGYNCSLAIGFGVSNTDYNQLVIGNTSHASGTGTWGVGGTADVYIGRGVTNTTLLDYLRINPTGASGTNIEGIPLILVGGRGTGTGDGGSVKIQVAPAGTSGSSLNTLEDAAEFDTDSTSGNTRFLLYDAATNQLQRVKVGSNGSGPGGTGRALYIDDTE